MYGEKRIAGRMCLILAIDVNEIVQLLTTRSLQKAKAANSAVSFRPDPYDGMATCTAC